MSDWAEDLLTTTIDSRDQHFKELQELRVELYSLSEKIAKKERRIQELDDSIDTLEELIKGGGDLGAKASEHLEEC